VESDCQTTRKNLRREESITTVIQRRRREGRAALGKKEERFATRGKALLLCQTEKKELFSWTSDKEKKVRKGVGKMSEGERKTDERPDPHAD